MPREGSGCGGAETDPSSQEINQSAGMEGPNAGQTLFFSFVLFDLDHGIKHASMVTLSCSQTLFYKFWFLNNSLLQKR